MIGSAKEARTFARKNYRKLGIGGCAKVLGVKSDIIKRWTRNTPREAAQKPEPRNSVFIRKRILGFAEIRDAPKQKQEPRVRFRKHRVCEPRRLRNNRYGVMWDAEEDSFLIENYHQLGSEKCSRLLPGRTPLAVTERFYQLVHGVQHNENFKWTDDYCLRFYYPTRGAKFCARLLDKNVSQIKTRIGYLGLRRRFRKRVRKRPLSVIEEIEEIEAILRDV